MNYYKYTYKKHSMLVVTIVSVFLCFMIPPHIITSIPNIYIQFIVLFSIFILHELFHGIGFRIAGAKSKNIVYGIKLEEGIFYCACKEEINKKGIMISLIFPIIFLTIIPFALAHIYKMDYLFLISFMNLIGASFDLFVFIDFCKLPSDFKYKDLDDTLGFILISKNDLRKYKYLNLKITESSKYNSKKIKASDYRKVTISKFSLIFIIILIILLLLLLCYNCF